MTKVATNLTLPKKVKIKGGNLAKRAGMSLSTYVAQLILKEVAKDEGYDLNGPSLLPAKRHKLSQK